LVIIFQGKERQWSSSWQGKICFMSASLEILLDDRSMLTHQLITCGSMASCWLAATRIWMEEQVQVLFVSATYEETESLTN
jgi:hypothetical protein